MQDSLKFIQSGGGLRLDDVSGYLIFNAVRSPFLGSLAGSIPRNRLYENYCACGRRSYISPRGDVVPFFRGHPASPGPLDDVCLKA